MNWPFRGFNCSARGLRVTAWDFEIFKRSGNKQTVREQVVALGRGDWQTNCSDVLLFWTEETSDMVSVCVKESNQLQAMPQVCSSLHIGTLLNVVCSTSSDYFEIWLRGLTSQIVFSFLFS